MERFPAFVNNSASSTVYQYCGNDLFDPNFTGAGGQPTYFDQLATLYNRYRVYASAIEVKWYNFSGNPYVYADCLLVPVNTTAASMNMDDLMALPRAKWQTVAINTPKTIKSAISTGTVLGVKDVEGADRLQAQVTASPAERWLWCIAAHSYDGVALVNVGCDIRITYECEFFDRKIQDLSLIRQSHDGTKPESKGQTGEEKKLPQSPTNSEADAETVVVSTFKVATNAAPKFDFMKRGLQTETPSVKNKDKK
jgi:hypothetical protein